MDTLSNIKKYDYYFVECRFKLVFKDNQNCPSVTSVLFDKETMLFGGIFCER